MDREPARVGKERPVRPPEDLMDQSFIDRVHAALEFERTRNGPPGDFSALPAIPAGRYSDAEFLELEKRYLWGRSWLYACHADQVPNPGAFLLWDRTGVPIVIVRGDDHVVRAFYNSCRHRGGPLVREPAGRVSRGLTCAFHGWHYDLEGRLQSVRDEQDFVDLDRSCLGLVPVRCEALGRWIFLSEDPAAPGLEDYLAPVAGQLQQFEPDRVRHVHSSRHDVQCNVKTLMEAFLEVYHLNTVHPGTAGKFLDYRGSHNMLWANGHSLMLTPNRDPGWVDPGTRGLAEFPHVSELPRTVNVSYNIYPNLVTPVATTGIPFLLFWPAGDERSVVECHWFAPDWGEGERHPLWDRRIENFERILQEDLDFAPELQKSIKSRGFTGSRLNYQERRIYHWHEELDRRIGAERIPAHLRVEPRLAGMIETVSTKED